MSQFAWTRAALSAFADAATPHVIGVERQGRLAALAPLVSRRVGGTERLCLAGSDQLPQPMDLLWSDRLALRMLVLALVGSGHPLMLERIAADSQSTDELSRACRGRALLIHRQCVESWHIRLDEHWLEPEFRLDAGRMSDLTRARRKAERLGQLNTEIHAPSLHELPELLDTVLELTAASDAPGEAQQVRDLERAMFYRHYAQEACVEGTLRICLLRIGDRVAAAQLAVETGGAFWVLLAGHDPHYAACWPEALLYRETIRYAAEAGLGSFEFLAQQDTWAQAWATGGRARVALAIYPLSLRGLTALVADAAAPCYRRLQAWIKRRVARLRHRRVSPKAPRWLPKRSQTIRPARRGVRRPEGV